MKQVIATFVILTMMAAVPFAHAAKDEKSKDAKKKPVPAVLKFTMKNIDGKKTDLSKYQGKVILMVNVASRCGYTKQYKGLQALHDKYAKKGLAVMGFPANNFGAQEPGNDFQIKQFCKSKYNVKFPMFSKVSVKGSDKCDLYKHLTDKKKVKVSQGEIRWNFEKFLIDQEGNVIKHYRSKTTPAEIGKDIAKLLKTKSSSSDSKKKK